MVGASVSGFVTRNDAPRCQKAQRRNGRPEDIRRRIRRGDINAVLIGRHYLVALSVVRQIEAAGQINVRSV